MPENDRERDGNVLFQKHPRQDRKKIKNGSDNETHTDIVDPPLLDQDYFIPVGMLYEIAEAF